PRAAPRVPPLCPVACYCPPDHPGAIYCDGRELHDVPRIPARVRFAYFQNNNIEALSECDLRDAGGLLGLNLDDNVLTSPTLSQDTLRSLRHLSQLHLQRNQLTEVPLGLPASLEDLRLGQNRIALVPKGAFARLSRLRMLDLSANRLQVLRDDAFAGLSALVQLNLAENRLRAMPPKVPALLYQLILCDNVIESIPDNYLASFPRLAWLDLGKNALGTREKRTGIPERAFISRALLNLRLSANHLQHVPAFHGNLVQLHLDENDIEDVNTTALCRPEGRESSRLSYFRLDKNPIMESPQAPVTLGKLMHCFPYLQPMF
uniref:Keratocan n=1 Tax=Petromyzon marinus TaxID=7757 RepID=S4RKJ9_PETMA